MRKRVLLLVNGASGTGIAKNMIFDMVRYLTLAGCEVVAYPIIPGEGLTSEEIIKKRHRGIKAVVCCGGDGTLHHVMNGICAAEMDLPICYIPLGSTNDFAHSLGIPDDLEKVCRAACGGRVFSCDVGRFNARYFSYIAAFGAFTKVSYATDQKIKNVLGYAAYVLSGILSLPESLACRAHLTITCDGKRMSGDYVFGAVSNATSVAGIDVSKLYRASMQDGRFEVILIQAPDNLVELGEILATLASGSLDNPYVKVFSAKHVVICSNQKLDWTMDGEFGGSHEKVDIQVCPGRLKLLLPE